MRRHTAYTLKYVLNVYTSVKVPDMTKQTSSINALSTD